MRSFWKSALLLSMAVSVSAQNHPYPGAVPDPPVICPGCPGTNAVGEPNAGKPTYPYDTPISLHAGRYVDSSNTANVQNLGMRTVRAGLVRVAPGTNRLYLGLGATVGAYTLDTFFSNKLKQPMVAVNTISTGHAYGGRNPFEKLAKPDRFFYPESSSSGWNTPAIETQTVLNDFDADDRGFVYVGTSIFGWGVISDPGGTDGSHLPSVAQVTDNTEIAALVSLESGGSYYAYTANATTSATLYNVTNTASIAFVANRTGSTRAFRKWSKYEAGERVALLNVDGHVRVYSYADLISGAAPLVDVTPTINRAFTDLSFDDDGNLWITEYALGSLIPPNILWELNPSGITYTTTQHFGAYGPAFGPQFVHAAAGYIAVGGETGGGSDLRLFRVVAGDPVLLDVDTFCHQYYDEAPSGYAQAGPFATPIQHVHIVAQGAKTYLFYSTRGLGDVYEISEDPRITSMTPLSGSPVGGTTVDLYGSGFTAAATVTFGGLTASSSFLSATHMTAVAPVHASGPVDVVVTMPSQTPMTAPRQFTYILDAPQNVAANATSTASITVTWNAVAGAMSYEVSRRQPAGTWTVIGTPSATTFVDGGRDAETTYVYRVRANDGAANFSASSAVDLATTMSSQSANIVAGMPIVAIDFTTLRNRVNAVRAAAGLSAYSYTGAISGVVLAQHLEELRTALTQGRTTLGMTTPAFTNPTPVAGATIKALHLNELLGLMK